MKYEAQAKYDKKNTIMITIKLNRKTNSKIIEKLQAVENRQRYIIGLIEKDIENNL